MRRKAMLDVCLNMHMYLPQKKFPIKSLDLNFHLEDMVKEYRADRQCYTKAKTISSLVYKKYFISQPRTEWQKDLGLQRAALTSMVVIIRDILKEFREKLGSTVLQQVDSPLHAYSMLF